jgi:glycosyltransferase involved in cell wall biosynthesis
VSGHSGIHRVLQVHTQYRQAGGEDRAVEAERVLLSQAGVDVRQVIFDNADLQESRSLIRDIELAGSAIWSRSAAERVASAIREYRPQVVHVHNTFAAASPSVFRAATALGVPVVQTLHNYRVVCPAATLFRDGHPCTDCVGLPVPLPAMVHACVRSSRMQSAVAAATVTIHRALGTYSRHVNRYIALTEFQRRLVVRALPQERVVVIPNFLEPDPGEGAGDRSGVLFVGRLSNEKGVATLLAAAELQPGIVSVAGEGPLIESIESAAARGRLRLLGSLDPPGVLNAMKRSVAVVIPSIWYEGFPMVVLEAFATATPVIASGIGSLAEVIDDAITGMLVEPGDGTTLARQVRWAVDHPDEMGSMGANARRRYNEQYRGRNHLAELLATYQGAASRRDSTGDA